MRGRAALLARLPVLAASGADALHRRSDDVLPRLRENVAANAAAVAPGTACEARKSLRCQTTT